MQLNTKHRSKLAYVSTLLILQRTPMMPVAKHVTGLLGKVVGKIWSWKVAIPSLVGAGSYHALSGATTEITGFDANPASGNEGDSFEFRFFATGIHEAESYRVDNLPSGLSYNGSISSPKITGTLPSAGDYTITIRGYENKNRTGGVTPSYPLVINVSSSNSSPVLSAVSSQTTDEDLAKVLTLTATDLDDDLLTYTATSDAPEVTAEVIGDQLTLTPASGWSGNANITVTVSDGNGGTDQLTFQLTVTLTANLWNDNNTTDLGHGWKSSNWLGLFYENENGWIYHQHHGWLYVNGTDESALWIFDPTLGWLYTGNSIYPFLYRNSTQNWLYFFNNNGSTRRFWDYASDGLLEVNQN